MSRRRFTEHNFEHAADAVQIFERLAAGAMRLQLVDQESAMSDIADHHPIVRLYSGYPQCIPEGENPSTNFRDLDFYVA